MVNDKSDATGYTPGRSSGYTSDQQWADALAKHGHGPVHVSGTGPATADGPGSFANTGYTAGRPPWDSQVHQDLAVQHGWPTPGSKKRSRWWVWAIVAVAGLALCAFGGLAVLGLGGKAVVNQVDKEAADRRADVVVTACSLGEFDTVTVKYTVHNHSDQSQSYLPQFDIQDAQGTVYGQAADVVNDLAPGKEYKGSAVSTVERAPGKAKLTCKLTNA